MFTAYDPDRRWLTVPQAARAMEVTPDAIVDAYRRGLLRWTITVHGVPMVEPAIIARHC